MKVLSSELISKGALQTPDISPEFVAELVSIVERGDDNMVNNLLELIVERDRINEFNRMNQEFMEKIGREFVSHYAYSGIDLGRVIDIKAWLRDDWIMVQCSAPGLVKLYQVPKDALDVEDPIKYTRAYAMFMKSRDTLNSMFP